jgi:hypothetical protein
MSTGLTLAFLDLVRASPRIASISRRVSYADLDGGVVSSGSEEEGDEFDSEMGDIDEEEEDFRPTKRTKGSKSYGRVKSYSKRKVRFMFCHLRLS